MYDFFFSAALASMTMTDYRFNHFRIGQYKEVAGTWILRMNRRLDNNQIELPLERATQKERGEKIVSSEKNRNV